MPRGHGIYFIFQKRPDFFGFCGIHDEHDALLEKRVVDLIGLFFQRQQTVLSGKLRHLLQCVHQKTDVVAVPLNYKCHHLGNRRQCLQWVAGKDRADRTADYDRQTRRIPEVPQLCRIDADEYNQHRTYDDT